MARRDLIHDIVRLALEKDNWIITADPFIVKVEGSRGIEIDLGAEKFIAAEKANEKIAVEIKSFISTSILNSFHGVLRRSVFRLSWCTWSVFRLSRCIGRRRYK